MGKPTQGPAANAAPTSPATTRALTIRDLPGPPGVPLLGNLPEFVRGGVPHRVLHAWCDRYGPTFRVKLATGQAIATADAKVINTILRERPDGFRRDSRMANILDELGGHGVFSAEGPRWRRLRRMAIQSLNAAYLREYFTTIARATERLKRLWLAAAVAGERVAPLRDLKRYTLDVTVGLAMGHDLNAVEQRGDGLHSRISLIFPEIARRITAPVPYWRVLRLPRDRRLDATVREIGDLVHDRFADAKRRMATGAPPTNFLEALVAPIEGEEAFTQRELLGNVLTMLLAGEDTTSSTAAWAVHYLAEHPEVQHRVRVEADEVLGDDEFAPDPATVGRLRYAEAVVNEATRLRPVAPFLFLQSLQDVVISGTARDLQVGRGTPIIALLVYGADRDTRRFPDPQAFRPERWLDDKTAAGPDTQPFLPFGAGPRFCPGRNLAMLEATLLTSMVCRNFDLESDTAAGPVGERMDFTMSPKNLRIRLRPRKVPPAAGTPRATTQ
ncbi:cytochrome P450 [Nonomuraea lactucae]|uniref:cytochrome P450 n=1 Tax=Nonomuraea lactucae TaxID=2249762 RepID=UPI0013B4499B|nr:cytochrome P450 [Nonomuraea lactucae]